MKNIEFNSNINGNSTDYSKSEVYNMDVEDTLNQSFKQIITDIINTKNFNTKSISSIEIQVTVTTE